MSSMSSGASRDRRAWVEKAPMATARNARRAPSTAWSLAVLISGVLVFSTKILSPPDRSAR
jgi:hypothetical protein